MRVVESYPSRPNQKQTLSATESAFGLVSGTSSGPIWTRGMRVIFPLLKGRSLLRSKNSGVHKKLSYLTRVAEPLADARCSYNTYLQQSLTLQKVCSDYCHRLAICNLQLEHATHIGGQFGGQWIEGILNSRSFFQ